ncbi:MAG TPA: class I SAM-dependent methyltransferase [Candidatus Acidoferrales bacterium]|jgi:SAM-dependent methyltransferase
MPEPAREEELRREFNRWAEAGKGEAMEHDHWPITQPVLARMGITADDNILDLGCGAGWLSRVLAKCASQGRVVGMDISDEMVRRARQKSVELENLAFIVGAAEEIPWESDFFSKMISVESSYYWPDPAKSLREVFRVLRDGGSAWILINYYRDNPHCHHWGAILEIPTKLLSAAEWAGLFRDAGFRNVAHQLIPDPTPNPETYSGRWFRDAKHLADFRAIGALLVHGEK